MNINETITGRRSIRSYTGEKVSPEVIKELIQLGTMAPSAMNSQPWAFFVIQNEEVLAKVNRLTKQHLLKKIAERPYMEHYRERFESEDFDVFYGASTLLVICGKPDQPSMEGDCHLAGQTIMLSAWEKKIGSCCLGFARMYLNTSEAKEWLGISEEYQIVLPIVLGYFEETPKMPERKKADILFWK